MDVESVNLNDVLDEKTVQHIVNIIRAGTTRWPGRNECFKRFSKLVEETPGKFKTYWQCNDCKSWYRNKIDLEMDHIKEIGSFTGSLNDYAIKTYCAQSNLQLLCSVCHTKKTVGYNASTRYTRKNKNGRGSADEEDLL